MRSYTRNFNFEDQMNPMQLIWLLDMDKKLYSAISNLFYSPFRPAPILQNMMVEFNIFKIDYFNNYILDLFAENSITKLEFNPKELKKKFMWQALNHFNEFVVKRAEQQMKLAVHFMSQDY